MDKYKSKIPLVRANSKRKKRSQHKKRNSVHRKKNCYFSALRKGNEKKKLSIEDNN